MQPTNPFQGQELARTPAQVIQDAAHAAPPSVPDLNESLGDSRSQLGHMPSSDSMRAAMTSSPIKSPDTSQADQVPTLLETFDAHNGPQHMAELMVSPAPHQLEGAQHATFSHSLRTILETIRHKHPDKVKALLQALLNEHQGDVQGVNSEPAPEAAPSAASEASSILEELFDFEPAVKITPTAPITATEEELDEQMTRLVNEIATEASYVANSGTRAILSMMEPVHQSLINSVVGIHVDGLQQEIIDLSNAHSLAMDDLKQNTITEMKRNPWSMSDDAESEMQVEKEMSPALKQYCRMIEFLNETQDSIEDCTERIRELHDMMKEDRKAHHAMMKLGYCPDAAEMSPEELRIRAAGKQACDREMTLSKSFDMACKLRKNYQDDRLTTLRTEYSISKFPDEGVDAKIKDCEKVRTEKAEPVATLELLIKVRQAIHKGQEQLYTLIPAIELMVRTLKTGDESVFFIQSAPEFTQVTIGHDMPDISSGAQTIMISQMKIVYELIDKKLRDFTSLERTIEVETSDGEVVQHIMAAKKYDTIGVFQYLLKHNRKVSYEDKNELVTKLHSASGGLMVGNMLKAIERIGTLITLMESMHLERFIHYEPTLKKFTQCILRRHSAFTDLAKTYLKFSPVDWNEKSIEYLRKFLNELAYVTRKSFDDGVSVPDLKDDKAQKAYKIYKVLFEVDDDGAPSFIGGAQDGNDGGGKTPRKGRPDRRFKSLGIAKQFWPRHTSHPGWERYIICREANCYRPTGGTGKSSETNMFDNQGEPTEYCTEEIKKIYNKCKSIKRRATQCGVKFCMCPLSASLVEKYERGRQKDGNLKIEPGACPICWEFLQRKAKTEPDATLDMMGNTRMKANGTRIPKPGDTAAANMASMVLLTLGCVDEKQDLLLDNYLATAGAAQAGVAMTAASPPAVNTAPAPAVPAESQMSEMRKTIDDMKSMIQYDQFRKMQSSAPAPAAPAPEPQSSGRATLDDMSKSEILAYLMQKRA